MPIAPQIVDSAADARFRTQAQAMGLNPDNLWVGEYVNYEWGHGRHIFELACEMLNEVDVLEFGCNFGATAIILAALGARVTAVDVNADYVKLAEANAARYGLSERISFLHAPDTSQLPFANDQFRYITCNSVLEYVPSAVLVTVESELDRLLQPGGKLFVLGTSNRLSPREVHSQRWFTNYLPRALDRGWLLHDAPERGLFPWQIVRPFTRGGRYYNCDVRDHGRVYLCARARMGVPRLRLAVLGMIHRLLQPFGLSVGLFTPSLSVILGKRSA